MAKQRYVKGAAPRLVPNAVPYYRCLVCPSPMWREGGITTAQTHLRSMHGVPQSVLGEQFIVESRPLVGTRKKLA